MTRRSVFLILALGACEDFDSPADLDRPQMVAIQANPSVLAPGERAELFALFLGADGEIVPDAATWAPAAAIPGEEPAGDIVIEGARVFFQPPAAVASPTPFAVELNATIGELSLRGVKGILGGAPANGQNPVIDTISVDGTAHDGMTAVAFPGTGAMLELSATLSPDPGESGSYAWYTTVGDIARYHDQTTTLELTEESTTSGSGWVFVVGRDGQGGIAWKSLPVEVP